MLCIYIRILFLYLASLCGKPIYHFANYFTGGGSFSDTEASGDNAFMATNNTLLSKHNSAKYHECIGGGGGTHVGLGFGHTTIRQTATTAVMHTTTRICVGGARGGEEEDSHRF